MKNEKATLPSVDPTRRRFLSQAAGVAAGGSVLALATIPPIAAASAPAAQLNESTLLKLEEQIFEQYEGACTFDDEILRLSEIWTTESHRLYKESLSREVQTGTYLTPQEQMGAGYRHAGVQRA
jgi:hypothetical protein